jgi:hypothetical protein
MEAQKDINKHTNKNKRHQITNKHTNKNKGHKFLHEKPLQCGEKKPSDPLVHHKSPFSPKRFTQKLQPQMSIVSREQEITRFHKEKKRKIRRKSPNCKSCLHTKYSILNHENLDLYQLCCRT